jgi:hypothetical protein
LTDLFIHYITPVTVVLILLSLIIDNKKIETYAINVVLFIVSARLIAIGLKNEAIVFFITSSLSLVVLNLKFHQYENKMRRENILLSAFLYPLVFICAWPIYLIIQNIDKPNIRLSLGNINVEDILGVPMGSLNLLLAGVLLLFFLKKSKNGA